MQARWRRDAAEVQPRCSRGAAEIWRRDAAEILRGRERLSLPWAWIAIGAISEMDDGRGQGALRLAVPGSRRRVRRRWRRGAGREARRARAPPSTGRRARASCTRDPEALEAPEAPEALEERREAPEGRGYCTPKAGLEGSPRWHRFPPPTKGVARVAGRASQSAAKAKPDRSLALERAVVLGRTSATMASQGEPAGVVAARPS
mmetsp:Transcript_8134/g.26187  ORF Transcript_8134/g.26187 Transcript_8134/m.26187 type:complete len:204 (-) Transcript_8134:548-1159(-)